VTRSPVMDEAAKLAAAIGDWARRRAAGPAVDAAVDAVVDAVAHGATEAVDRVRGAAPEVLGHLAAAGASLGAAAAALFSPPGGHPAPEEPVVQDIPVVDEPDPPA